MKTFLALVLCLSLAGSVEAAKKPKKPAPAPNKPTASAKDAEFKKWDTSGDGLLNPREFAAGSKEEKPGKAFAKLDKDKNGVISPSEFRSGGTKEKKKK